MISARSGRQPTAGGLLSRLTYECARKAGLKIDDLLNRASLTSRQITDATLRIKVSTQIKFVTIVADELKDESLGARLGAGLEPRALGWLFYVMASCDSLGESLKRAERYCNIANEGVVLRCDFGSKVRILLNYRGVRRDHDRHQIEFFIAVIVNLCRYLTGSRLSPDRVRVMHRQNGGAEIRGFFGCGLQFGASADEIIYDAAVAHIPLTSADPYLHDLLAGYLDDVLSRRVGPKNCLRTEVENTIAALLPHGRLNEEDVATKLRMSRRTLVRRLAAEKLTFSRITEELRADLAQRYLDDPSLSISQVAWLLGYREASAFSRAFKKWTSETPSAFRCRGPQ